MSDDDRKSMDDVLASIRRIVRTERQDADAAGTDQTAHGGREGFVHETDIEEPLILTPEMRIDRVDAPEDSRDAGSAYAPADAPSELDADIADASAAPAMPDAETLRTVLREILREELPQALSDARVADAVREIVRDELVHGEIGDNISRNVERLIRDEVAKALADR
jgi:hypothetical protein